jgi:hypothetical protein
MSAFDPRRAVEQLPKVWLETTRPSRSSRLATTKITKLSAGIVALGQTGAGVTIPGSLAKSSTPPVTRRIFFWKAK